MKTIKEQAIRNGELLVYQKMIEHIRKEREHFLESVWPEHMRFNETPLTFNVIDHIALMVRDTYLFNSKFK